MHDAEQARFEKFNASDYRVAIVASQFNWGITEDLLGDALKMLSVYKISHDLVEIYRVAGCIEIPVVLQGLAGKKQYDCLVALGAVVRGETPHFDYVAKIVSEGILKVMLDFGIAVGFGIITTDNIVQAQARTRIGGAAVEAALHNAKLLKVIIRR